MFNKTNKPTSLPKVEPQPVPVQDIQPVAVKKAMPSLASTSAKAASVIFSNLVITGNVSGSGDLHLDGTVKGDVKVSQLSVGESGNIEGKVEADIIEVRGRVLGSIIGKQVKLTATAYVEGDITHDQLSIDVGAYFQGRCLQTRRPESAPVAPVLTPQATSVASEVRPIITPVAAPSPTASINGGPNLSNYDMGNLSDLKPKY